MTRRRATRLGGNSYTIQIERAVDTTARSFLPRSTFRPALVGLRLRHAELVLDGLHAVDPVGHLGRLRAHRDVRHLAAQHDNARVGADVDLLELRVLAEAGLDGLRDLLVV